MERVIANVSSYSLGWILKQETKIHQWLERLTLQTAIAHAYKPFSEQHPRWAASLFDEYFLNGSAAPLLRRYLHSTEPLAPSELANAWFNQLGPMCSSIFKRGTAEANQIAADFLSRFEAELKKIRA